MVSHNISVWLGSVTQLSNLFNDLRRPANSSCVTQIYSRWRHALDTRKTRLGEQGSSLQVGTKADVRMATIRTGGAGWRVVGDASPAVHRVLLPLLGAGVVVVPSPPLRCRLVRFLLPHHRLVLTLIPLPTSA